MSAHTHAAVSPRWRPLLLSLTALTLCVGSLAPTTRAQGLLDADAHPKFEHPLPIPARIDAVNVPPNVKFNMEMREVEQWLGLFDADGNPLMTTVWGYGLEQDGEFVYGPSYPGPTFEAYRDVKIRVHWKNKLPRHYDFPYGPRAHLLPVDPNLHIAHPNRGGVPTVAHLHGGHTESASDGLPEAWFTQNGERGRYWVKPIYEYDNDQEAATLWYHDHALGITRLNVAAGLAGFYLLRDDQEVALTESGVLPGGPYEIETVVQDRYFTDTGQIFWPAFPGDPAWDDFIGDNPMVAPPSILAEFFGDFILVNGRVWPKLDVEPRKYRFRLLNGSDSRFYVFQLDDGTPILQIGTDNGLLRTPVSLDRLVLAPGERADVVLDFAGMEGSSVTMLNFGPDEPFKGFNPDGTISDGDGGVVPPADPNTTGRILRFDVSLPLDPNVPDATVDASTRLRDDLPVLEQDGATRKLVLFEGMDEFGRLQPLLGTMDDGALVWDDPITENPMLNDTEVWEIYNATEDGHPIHLHLVAFQVIDRQAFTGEVIEIPVTQHNGAVGVGGKLLEETVVLGDSRAPEDNELGWKDTVIAYPGEVTRVIARFDREGRYVWHCHILSHEDHEMMRPFHVGPIPMEPGHQMAENEDAGDAFALSASPSPFNPRTEISFRLDQAGGARLAVYDVRGRLVHVLADGDHEAGVHAYAWDGQDDNGQRVSSGTYFARLSTDDGSAVQKMVLTK